MQSDLFLYDPALDDGGGGGLSADLLGSSSREHEDPIYADSFELFIPNYSDRQPPESLLPQIPSRNPMPSPVPLNGQELGNFPETNSPAYHYFRSSSSSLTQANTSHCIYSPNNYYSPSTLVPGHLDGAPDVPLYQHIYPANQSLSTGQSSLTEHSQWAASAPDYSGHTSILPLRDKSFEGFHERLPGGSEPCRPLPQYQVDRLPVHDEHHPTFADVPWSYPIFQQPPGPFVTASGPHAATLARSTFQPQGIGVNFAMASPGSQAHYTPYAAPPHIRGDHNLFPFTGEQSFDLSLLCPPPDHPAYRQESRHHPGDFRDLIPTNPFDFVDVGTVSQDIRLYGDARRTFSTSDLSMPPFQQHYLAPTTWPEPVPHRDPSHSSLPLTTTRYDKSPPQTIPFSPEASGYASQAGRTDSDEEASPSSPTTVGAPSPLTRRRDTPKYGILNTFLSPPASCTQVRTRSTHYRARVLKPDDVPPNLRPYYQNHHPIPLPEYETLFITNQNGEFCVKCNYDVTYPRRKGLKYEHANVHLNNRPFHCLDCDKRYCRPTAHPKGHPIRLPPSHN